MTKLRTRSAFVNQEQSFVYRVLIGNIISITIERTLPRSAYRIYNTIEKHAETCVKIISLSLSLGLRVERIPCSPIL